MKYYLAIIIIIGICIFLSSLPSVDRGLQESSLQAPVIFSVTTPTQVPSHVVSFDELLDAIEWVESRGDPNAKGDFTFYHDKKTAKLKGYYRAVGAYQIHKIYVDDVNRIMKLFMDRLDLDNDRIQYAAPVEIYDVPHYSFNCEDRWNKELSRVMTQVYIQHYGKGKSFEDMARIHNGGPQGYKKESTKPYWAKVKKRLFE